MRQLLGIVGFLLSPLLVQGQNYWEVFDVGGLYYSGHDLMVGSRLSEGDTVLMEGSIGETLLVSNTWDVLELSPGVHVLPAIQDRGVMRRRNSAMDFFEDRLVSSRTGAVEHALPAIDVLCPPKRSFTDGSGSLGLLWDFPGQEMDSVKLVISFSNIFDEEILRKEVNGSDGRASIPWSELAPVLDSMSRDSVVIVGFDVGRGYRETTLGIFLSNDGTSTLPWDLRGDMSAAECLSLAMWLEENHGAYAPWVAYFYSQAAELSDRFRYQEWLRAYQRRVDAR